MFSKLISYYQDVPAETARFTNDREMLQTVERISAERVALVRKLEAWIASFAASALYS